MNEFIDDLQSQLDEDPSSRIFYKLGELFRRQGRPEKAVEVLRQGLEHHPRYVAAWVALGRAQSAQRQHEDAELSFARALELDPENGVAARLLGETAMARQDWVRAIKGLKLARALSPGDTELDDLVAEVEARLAEEGQLEEKPEEPATTGPPGPDTSVDEEVFDVGDGPAPADADADADTQDPFAITQEDLPAPGPPPPREPVSLAGGDEDPFSLAAPGDSGVWSFGDDVFAVEAPTAADEPDEERGVFAPAGDEPEEAPVFDQVEEGPELEAEVAPVEPFAAEDEIPTEEPVEPELAAGPAAETAATEEVEDEEARDQETDDAAAYSETVPGELPLPTLTLARLAVDQGDLDLAEKTLRSLLARDPSNAQAAELLRDVLDQGPRTMPLDAATRLKAAKAGALRGWLEEIRLAAERVSR